MLKRIDDHPDLSKILSDSCCENGICVTIDETIEAENIRILKVDEFYNSLNIEKRPPSIDCLIIRKCRDRGYGITLVELKNISKGASFTVENLKGKFETTFFDFIKRRFKEVLDSDYIDVKCYFVSKLDLNPRDMGLKLKLLMDVRFKFNDQRIMIKPLMPDPTIKNCYN